MAFTKPKPCHGTCWWVFNYLENGGVSKEGHVDRALGHDTNMMLNGRPWYKVMDETRRQFGHDRPPKNGGEPRTYYHYVLAPDPKDFEEISPEEGLRRVRELATRWAQEYVPNNQWMIVYHDDGANGNIHAHVVVNTSNMLTGKKHHESNADFARACAITDRLCREVGLSVLMPKPGDEEYDRVLEDANHSRRESGEKPVERTAPRRHKTATQPRVVSGPERYLRGRSWKSLLRQAIDAAVMDSASFEDFQRLLRQRGYDVYQNKRGELVYVWSDGERRIRDYKLGLMYQTDLLATRFMDLRFTRAGWETNRGRWSRSVESGERVARLTIEEVEHAERLARKYGCIGLSDVELRLNAARDALRIVTDEIESMRKTMDSLQADLRDARLVESLAPSIEPSRIDGRVVSAPVTADVLRSYEAARKHLLRREHPTDVSSLEQSVEAMRVNILSRTDRMGELSTAAEELTEAYRVAKAIDSHVTAGADAERERYGERLRHADEAFTHGATRRTARRVATQRAGKRQPLETDALSPSVISEEEWVAWLSTHTLRIERHPATPAPEPTRWDTEASSVASTQDTEVEVGYDQVAHPEETARPVTPQGAVQEPVEGVPERDAEESVLQASGATQTDEVRAQEPKRTEPTEDVGSQTPEDGEVDRDER